MALPASLSRRQLLQAAALGGMGLLAGCGSSGPQLVAVRGSLPPAWLKPLPKPWRAQLVETPQAVLAAAGRPDAALLSLGDGWATLLASEALQPFGAGRLLAGLDPLAAPVSRLFRPQGAPALAFPWAFGPWLLLLRSRPDLARRRAEGWDLLLDPSLRGRVLLPSSPRLVIALGLHQLGLQQQGPAQGSVAAAATAEAVARMGADPTASATAALEDPRLRPWLRRLRAQALAFDERDGLNLVLAGDAEAAVLPSHQVLPLLRRDPRLTALLPESGAPLWWQLLLRPAVGPGQLAPPLPLEWLADGLSLPLLDRLLAGGWVPPLPRQRLAPALARWPEPLRELLLPPAPLLERCTNLAPFTPEQRQRWQQLWDATAA
ncbi:hypothetical protein [Vulcanococcus limneticus]|uniref:hypothetical protein n=1 Tax=Vulcanococcus limneticus TaxID=2170428 RepID=UPI00398C1DC2